jgi:phage tail tape-measure protein
VGGLAGAVWADNDRNGQVDGYNQNGQYTAGAPAGYDPATRCVNVAGSAATGAGIGAVGGAGVGAVVGGVSPITGAVVGALVGGLAGAVYADANNDGCVDGYTQGGQYYQGAPQPGQYQQQQYQAPVRSGERG